MSPSLRALLLTAALVGLHGAWGIYLTGTSFPWEGCKQDVDTGLYTAEFESYTRPNRSLGWSMCWRIKVKDQAACNATQALMGPRNQTRCCATTFNKFRMWPALRCRNTTHQSVASVTLGGVRMSRFTWDFFNNSRTGFQPQWALKMTPLGLNITTANNYQVCINLRPPCDTMELFAPDGRTVEWALYDPKINNYECCPVGVTPVQTTTFPTQV